MILFLEAQERFKYTFYNKLYKNSWNANTIISMAIGQGELLLTPIQMANLAAIIANKGFYYTPHMLLKRLKIMKLIVILQ